VPDALAGETVYMDNRVQQRRAPAIAEATRRRLHTHAPSVSGAARWSKTISRKGSRQARCTHPIQSPAPHARLGNALILLGLLNLGYAGLWELGIEPRHRATLPAPVALQRSGPDSLEVAAALPPPPMPTVVLLALLAAGVLAASNGIVRRTVRRLGAIVLL
jgi:hypothetical protein